MADIDEVKDRIEADAEAHGFSDEEIQRRLDDGQSVPRIAETYWRKRAQAFLLIVSTSEAGSTRGNDVIYNRMVSQAEMYAAEASQTQAVVSSVERIGSFPIRRV